MEKPKGGPAIGIDLGTTYSCVGVWQHERVEIIANDLGSRTTPSWVAFTDSERLVGEAAMNQSTRNPENTVFDAKRMIGRRWSDKEVQDDIKSWPFKVVQRQGDKPFIQVTYLNETKEFSPEEISSMVLSKIKAIAESFLGTTVQDAVITVPAYFNDAQRVSTKQAGAISGLNVLRIINEPTSAAIAYGLEQTKENDKERTILVFDYGGGTLDVSILTLDSGVFEVKATGGDTHLGGEDLDRILLDHFIREFKMKHASDIVGNQRALRRLRTACEKAKRAMSGAVQASIELDSLVDGIDFYSTITRARFEELAAEEFRKCIRIVASVLIDAKLDKKSIDEIVMVGGSTRIPKIQTLLEGFFEGKKVNKSINPDEAVAYGAAVQAGIVTGKVKGSKAENVLLIDVNPVSLGLATQGGVMAVVIARNSTIPCQQKKTFSTTRDNQDHVDIQVYEGERANVRDNNLLGTFTLEGIPAARRAEPQIEVTFDIDANGILNVTAEDLKSKKKGQIQIKGDQSRLSATDVERMLKDAEEFQRRDQELLEVTDWMNSLENYAYNIATVLEKTEVAQNIEPGDAQQLQKLKTELINWIDANPRQSVELETIKAKRKEAEAIYNPIMTKTYAKIGHTVDPEYLRQQQEQQQQQQQQQQQGQGQGGQDDNPEMQF